MNQHPLENCECIDLGQGIKEYVVHVSSRQSVVELFDLLRITVSALPEHEVARSLISLPITAIPIVAVTPHFRAWTRDFGTRTSRTAVLYDGSLTTIADVLMHNLAPARARTRVFKTKDRATAIAWLAADGT